MPDARPTTSAEFASLLSKGGAKKRSKATGEQVAYYRCRAVADGGCAGIMRKASTLDAYVTQLVADEHRKLRMATTEDVPPWPKETELADLQERMRESQLEYENGTYPARLYFPSIERMEGTEAVLLRERRAYERGRQARKRKVANLADRWDDPDFTIEEKQAAIAACVSAVVVMPSGKGGRFHPDQLKTVFNETP